MVSILFASIVLFTNIQYPGLSINVKFYCGKLIAAHTHFCLTETFVNFDPTPNALRNTTPFSPTK